MTAQVNPNTRLFYKFLLGDTRSAHQCFDSSNKLLRLERLAHIVLDTCVEVFKNICPIVARGQHHQWQGTRHFVFPNALGKVDAAHTWDHPVQDDELVAG